MSEFVLDSSIAFDRFKFYLAEQIEKEKSKGDKIDYVDAVTVARAIYSVTEEKSIPLAVFDFIDSLWHDGQIERIHFI